MSGSGLDLTYIRDSPQFDSLIWIGYAGQSDGLAISNVVFDQYNPGRRLPIAMYSASYVDNHRVLVRLFRVNVTNTGEISGDDVVLAFVRSRNATMNGEISPIKQLFGFERVSLAVNQSKDVFFPLTVQHLLTIARDGTKWLRPGSYDILIGEQHMHTLKLYGQSIQWASKRHVFSSNENI
ncbi:unnamed protein product [Rotaria sp. Silwood2]|nr:unnamed protein product [Rotaria sp. Silwood2]